MTTSSLAQTELARQTPAPSGEDDAPRIPEGFEPLAVPPSGRRGAGYPQVRLVKTSRFTRLLFNREAVALLGDVRRVALYRNASTREVLLIANASGNAITAGRSQAFMAASSMRGVEQLGTRYRVEPHPQGWLLTPLAEGSSNGHVSAEDRAEWQAATLGDLRREVERSRQSDDWMVDW